MPIFSDGALWQQKLRYCWGKSPGEQGSGVGGSKPEVCPQSGLFLAQNGIILYFCKAGAHSAQTPAKLCHGGGITFTQISRTCRGEIPAGCVQAKCDVCKETQGSTNFHCPGDHGPGVSGGPSPRSGTLRHLYIFITAGNALFIEID